jgi:hypothetical protein
VDAAAVVGRSFRRGVEVLDGHTTSPHVHFMSLRGLLESLISQSSDYLIYFTDFTMKVLDLSVFPLSIRRFVGLILLQLLHMVLERVVFVPRGF